MFDRRQQHWPDRAFEITERVRFGVLCQPTAAVVDELFRDFMAAPECELYGGFLEWLRRYLQTLPSATLQKAVFLQVMQEFFRRRRACTLTEEGWHAFMRSESGVNLQSWLRSYARQSSSNLLENHLRRYVECGHTRPEAQGDLKAFTQQRLTGKVPGKVQAKRNGFRVSLMQTQKVHSKQTATKQKTVGLSRKGQPSVAYASSSIKGMRFESKTLRSAFMKEKIEEYPTLPAAVREEYVDRVKQTSAAKALLEMKRVLEQSDSTAARTPWSVGDKQWPIRKSLFDAELEAWATEEMQAQGARDRRDLQRCSRCMQQDLETLVDDRYVEQCTTLNTLATYYAEHPKKCGMQACWEKHWGYCVHEDHHRKDHIGSLVEMLHQYSRSVTRAQEGRPMLRFYNDSHVLVCAQGKVSRLPYFQAAWAHGPSGFLNPHRTTPRNQYIIP